MQPSSLIFLVVIAIWAAYLVQHWLTRREHLSTARSLDRFSESMRVLDRSRAAGSAPVGTGASAASVHRRQVTVSRAEALLARTEVASSAKHSVSASAKALGDKAVGRARELGTRTGAGVPARTRDTAKPGNSAATRGGSVRRAPATPAIGRATRGVLVVAGAALSALTLILAGAGWMAWRYPVAVVLMTIGAWLWLRRAVAAERAARRRSRPHQARTTGAPSSRSRAADSRVSRSGTVQAGGERAAARTGATHAAPAAVAATAASAAAETPSAPARPAVYDLVALEAAERAASEEAAAAAGWKPVPVPPPTYTMKARASYPEPADEIIDDEADDITSPYAEPSDLAGYAAERARLSS